MARSRHSDPIDDRDEEYSDQGQHPDDMENAFPKKSSPMPWFLLAIVVIFSGSVGYLGYTKLMEMNTVIVKLKTERDAAKTKATQLEADLAGAKKESETLGNKVTELEGQLKTLKDQTATASSDKSDGADSAAAVSSAKGSTKGKTTSAKSSSSSKKKKSSRR